MRLKEVKMRNQETSGPDGEMEMTGEKAEGWTRQAEMDCRILPASPAVKDNETVS